MKLSVKALLVGLLTAAVVLSSPMAAFAGSFVNGIYGSDTVSSQDNTRFVFLSPFTILDTIQGVRYSTASEPCSNDNLYHCKDYGEPLIAGSYWYWPNKVTLAAQNGQCAAALLYTIQASGDKLKHSRLDLVQPELGAGQCAVKDTSGTVIDKNNIEGWGAGIDATDITTTEHTSSQSVQSKMLTRLDKGTVNDKAMFLAAGTYFQWKDGGEIDSYAGSVQAFKVAAGTPVYQGILDGLNKSDSITKKYATGYDFYFPTSCVDSKNNVKAFLAVDANPDNKNLVTMIHRVDGDSTKAFTNGWYGSQQSCLMGGWDHDSGFNGIWGGSNSDATIGIANVENTTKPPVPGASSNASGSGSTAASATIDCNLDGNPLTWVICPIVDGMTKLINAVDRFITSALTFDTTTVFVTQKGYYQAWNTFRVMATALIVIAGLVMVASQAFGFEFLDAYTIRKVLPRLLIAVIGISLSWPLLHFIIEFFNDFGLAVRNLIYSPFSELKGSLGGSTLLAANLAAITALAFLGFIGLLSLLATAVLALLVAFAIIVVRDLALILIIIIAPVAIACFVLPNTEKVWKLWSTNLLGLLLMFPIISAFIAVGRVFSAVSLQASSGAGGTTGPTGAGTISQIVGIVAYFVPYFLLPVAFRLATGVIGTIAGFANDRGRGAFDRLKKFRGNKIAENSHAMSSGTRFNNGMLNAATSRATTKRMGFGSQGREAYEQKMSNASMEFAKSGAGQALQHNDGALRALTYASAADAQANMAKDFGMDSHQITEAISAAKASGGFGRARQVYAAQQLAATGTGYDNIQQVARTIARTSNGNASQASALSGNINSATKQAGRYDLAPGYSTLNSLSQSELGGNGPDESAYHAASVAAARGVDAVSMLRGKPKQVEYLTQSLSDHAKAQKLRIDHAATADERTAATDEFLQTMGQIDQLNQNKSYASAENQEIVNTLLNDTASLRGDVYTMTGGNVGLRGGPIGPLTPEMERNRARYNQTSAPRQNPNDPNTP